MSTWAASARSIDPRVRDAALNAVKRHNMPVGDWLARALDDADADVDSPPEGEAPPQQGGGDRLRRLADALERLAAKVESGEQRSTVALFSVDRAISEVSSRLAGTEAGMREETLRLVAALGEIKELSDALVARLGKLEDDPSAQRALDALRTIEQRLDAMTAHVHEQETRGHAETEGLREEVARVGARADADAAAIRASLHEAEERYAESMAGLRRTVEALETSAAEIIAGQRRLSDTVAGVAASTAELYGGQKRLEDGLAAVAGRIEAVEGATRGEALDRRFADVAALAERAANELEQRMGETLTLREARFDERLSSLGARLGEALGVVDARAERLSARLGALETAHAQGVQALRSDFAGLNARLDVLSGGADDGRFDALRAALEEKIESVRRETSEQLVAAAAAVETAKTSDAIGAEEFDETLAALNARLAAAENRHVQTVETVSGELRRLTDAIDQRLRALEARPVAGADPEAGARFEEATLRLQAERASIDARFAGLAQTIDARLDESNARADARLSEALAQIGARLEEVSRAASAAPAPLSPTETAPSPAQEAEPPAPALTAAEPPAPAALDLRERFDPAPLDIAPVEIDSVEVAAPLSLSSTDDPPAAEEPLATPPRREERWSDLEADGIDDLLAPEPAHDRAAAGGDADRPSTKQDYIAAARKAALAQAERTGRKPRKGGEPAEKGLKITPGAVRLGAAGLIAIAVAGGVLSLRGGGVETEPGPQEEPAAQSAEAAPSDSIAAAVQDQPRAGPAQSLEEAAAGGDPVAQYELGVKQLTSGAVTEGATQIALAADQGLAMAQYRLAKLYERGEGVPQNLGEARRWTERAATGGNRKAMHDLGVYNARGEGAPQDEIAAFRWFREAASYGVVDSQFNLGVLYEQGRGAPQDAAEALFWFRVAARGGDKDAGERAALLEARLAPDVATRIAARAESFTPKPANARANGDFGPTPWSGAATPPAAPSEPAPALR